MYRPQRTFWVSHYTTVLKMKAYLPRHHSKRLLLSSQLSLVLFCITLMWGTGHLLSLSNLCVSAASLNHWRHPVIGIRRTLDMLVVALATFTHIAHAISASKVFWQYGILVLAAGVLFGMAQNIGRHDTNLSSAVHMSMHIVGFMANVYLYLDMHEEKHPRAQCSNWPQRTFWIGSKRSNWVYLLRIRGRS